MDKNTVYDWMFPFVIGGFSGALATCMIQPLDTLKVQMQIVSERLGKSRSDGLAIINVFYKIKSQKGLKVFYRGLDSAVFRQIFYASARLGSYDIAMRRIQKYQKRKPTNPQKAFASVLSGVFGALIGNPFDVALIRRQASISSGQRNYKNTYQAFKSIIKDEGIRYLYSGLNITMVRVVLINFTQLAGRDYISQYYRNFQILNSHHNNFVALTASVLTALISLPADNVKVKLQKQEKNMQVYSGMWDCFVKTTAREGPLRLWVGFPIYLIRGAPHSFIVIRTQLYLNEVWQSYNKKN